MNKFPYGNLKYVGGGNNTAKEFHMKKLGLIVFFALCMSAISYGQANNGTFTLTGIPSQYNGKYVYLDGECRDGELLGFISFNEAAGDITLPRISNGRVSIPMWLYKESTDSLSRYSGNHTVEFVEIVICDSADGDDEIAEIEFEDVVFRSGSATKSWNEGEVWD